MLEVRTRWGSIRKTMDWEPVGLLHKSGSFPQNRFNVLRTPTDGKRLLPTSNRLDLLINSLLD